MPIINPKSYQHPELLISYIRTPGLNRLTKNVIGNISPCHNPAKKPAGEAPFRLYFELGPGVDKILAMVLK